jgi:hypothetical protein
MIPQRRSIERPVENKLDWLWTWNGDCFGYRQEASLFTYDGVEVGRFLGPEVYSFDGRYLGEMSAAQDGYRLITNVYKKSRTQEPFAISFSSPQRRLSRRPPESPITGHEDFPSPEIVKQRQLGLH